MGRRARRPVLERLEGRAVPSSLTVPLASVAAARAAHNEILNPTGVPTPHELRRQRFRATFSGPYVIGPGRFSGQQWQVFIRGVGTSNAFLHGDVMMKVAQPTAPGSVPSGTLTMFDRNINYAGQLGLILTGIPGAVDRHGRPTRFAFEVDPGTSAAVFAESSGSGILDVRYIARGVKEGTALLRARGRIYTLGTTSNIRNASLDP